MTPRCRARAGLLSLGFALFLAPAALALDETPEAIAKAAASVDDQYGFRGLRFDKSYKKIKGLKQVPQKRYRSKKVRAFVRINEKPTLFGHRIAKIRYYFHKGKLFEIEFNGYDSLTFVKDFAKDLGIPKAMKRTEKNNAVTYAFRLRGKKVTVRSRHTYSRDAATQAKAKKAEKAAVTTITLNKFVDAAE